MPDHPTCPALLPHRLPDDDDSRTVLIAFRRMAIHGLRDASAANLLLARFGLGALRITCLLRSLIVDIAGTASGKVMVAPCCAPRMTRDERLILSAIAEPDRAAEALLALTGSADCLLPIGSTRTLSAVLADLGRPVRL